MRKRVAIFGGGVAGLSAAHELSRSFEVHVFEADEALGGKARSQAFTGTGQNGRADLPGEHGFRFFPAFYRNVRQTLAEIPIEGSGTVADRLVACDEFAWAEPTQEVIRVPRNVPRDVGDFFQVADALEDLFVALRPRESDLARLTAKLLIFMTSCDERRYSEYEDQSFWSFIEGDSYEPRFQRLLNSSRFMVAMQARHGSARTIGRMALQLLLDFRRPASRKDQVLNGPSSEQWIAPWVEYLTRRGVVFHTNSQLTRFEIEPGNDRVSAAILGAERFEADYFLAALPIERLRACIDDALADVDSALAKLRAAPLGETPSSLVGWMVGAQYYLRREIPVCRGHVAYPASTWALSSISQAQFWKKGVGPAGAPRFEDRFGDGTVRDVLSVDISDWFTPNDAGLRARDCRSADEVLDNVWTEIEAALNGGGQPVISREDVLRRRLDSNVRFVEGRSENTTPLLVHPPGSLRFRPRAFTEIPNLMLAGDYVQTSTDLATMESANESARLAANAIFADAGAFERAAVYPLTEDTGILAQIAKQIDRARWRAATEPPLSILLPARSLRELRQTLEGFARDLAARADALSWT